MGDPARSIDLLNQDIVVVGWAMHFRAHRRLGETQQFRPVDEIGGSAR